MLLFRALTHRPFAFLWTGQTISRLGDHIHRIALAWWVLEQTGSAAAMGTVLIFATLPMLLFLLIGGVAVDRFSRVRVMIASDALRAIVVAMVAALAFARALELWHILIASVAFGFVDAFFQPAYVALVPEITPRDLLPSANSLTSLSGRITGIVGPGVGAAIVALGGTPTAFALDALSFFLSAVCLVPIIGLSSARAEKSTGVLRDLREGLAAVFASPWLWVTIVIFAFANVTLDGPISVALPLLVKNHLRADVGELGLLYSASALGSILAALYLGRFKRLRRRGLLLYGAAMVAALGVLAIGLPITIYGVAVAILVFGFCVAFVGLVWTNTLQEMVPRDLLGRVSSVDWLGSGALLPIGYGLTGWVADSIGAANIFLIGGAVSLGLMSLGLLHPQVRAVD